MGPTGPDSACPEKTAAITGNEIVENNHFRISRGFPVYGVMLRGAKLTLIKIFRSLPDGSIWIDMGAGLAKAQRDIFSTFRRVWLNNISQFVSIGRTKPDDPGLNSDLSEYADKFKYLDGEYLEDMYASGRLNPYKGKVGILTDDYGILSYIKDLALGVQIYLDLLRPGGVAVFTVELEQGIVVGGLKMRQGRRGFYRRRTLEFIDENRDLTPAEKDWFVRADEESIPDWEAHGVQSDTAAALVRWLNQTQGASVIDYNVRIGQHQEANGDVRYSKMAVIYLRKDMDGATVSPMENVDYVNGAPPKRIYHPQKRPH